MRLVDLDPEQIASIEFEGRLYELHGDQRWFRATHARMPILPMLNGNYFGHRLLVTMRPRQVTVATGMSVSSSVAFVQGVE